MRHDVNDQHATALMEKMMHHEEGTDCMRVTIVVWVRP